MSRILIVDDNASIRKTLQLHLKSSFNSVETSSDLGSARDIWVSLKPDIVLLDLRLPDGDGLDLLEKAVAEKWGGLVIIITGHGDMEKAILAMRMGAYDYLQKPLDIEQLDAVMERAYASSKASPETKVLITEGKPYRSGQIVSKSRVMLEIHKQIGLASRCFANVLIRGETGTGKELVAKSIHRNSLTNGPFIAVNCSAIVATLLESELFGHEKGAFTGAVSSKPGQLEAAKNGVIFLDEIGDLPLDMQIKFLRVLQEREFRRVGGSQTIPLKARVIAATHRDLERMLAEGEFREDLYYRLKVLEIMIPPLRERREDIPLLVKSLLSKINHQVHRDISKVPVSAMKKLQEYDWPGNVRELENLLTAAVIRSPGETLEIDFDFAKKSEPQKREKWDWNQTLEDIEKKHIMEVLANVEGHFGRACEVLGISRPTLRKKIKDYGLKTSFNDE